MNLSCWSNTLFLSPGRSNRGLAESKSIFTKGWKQRAKSIMWGPFPGVWDENQKKKKKKKVNMSIMPSHSCQSSCFNLIDQQIWTINTQFSTTTTIIYITIYHIIVNTVHLIICLWLIHDPRDRRKMQSFLPLSSNTVWIYEITSWRRTSIADLYMLSIAIIYSVWLLVGGASRPYDVRIAIAPIWLHWFPHSCLMLQVWGMWVSLSQLICCGLQALPRTALTLGDTWAAGPARLPVSSDGETANWSHGTTQDG